jgi:hypothetical protein
MAAIAATAVALAPSAHADVDTTASLTQGSTLITAIEGICELRNRLV